MIGMFEYIKRFLKKNKTIYKMLLFFVPVHTFLWTKFQKIQNKLHLNKKFLPCVKIQDPYETLDYVQYVIDNKKP